MQQTELQKLIELQKQLGYITGPISSVAMLGLIGEAGEVLAETDCSLFVDDNLIRDIGDTLRVAVFMDNHKKAIRKTQRNLYIFEVPDHSSDNFDSELADTFYYLNILATNRGLTIEDLARMGREKVERKIAEGGSSEDPTKKFNA